MKAILFSLMLTNSSEHVLSNILTLHAMRSNNNNRNSKINSQVFLDIFFLSDTPLSTLHVLANSFSQKF